jgi:hypothetical protein
LRRPQATTICATLRMDDAVAPTEDVDEPVKKSDAHAR